MPNGHLAGKIVDLMQKRPAWALIFMLIIFAISGGATGYGSSFFGQKSALERAIADAESNTINVRVLHIEEIKALKSEGKLQSAAEIRLVIIEELQKYEDRLYKRLKLNN